MGSGSVVWKFFDKLDEDGQCFTKCKLCETKLKYSSTTTGSMLNHLRYKHPKEFDAESGDTSKSSKTSRPTHMQSYFTKPLSITKSDQITALISELMFKDFVPIKIVESVTFKKLIATMEPNYKMPTRKTITAIMEKKYEDLKCELKEKLSSSDISLISSTTDCWTSMNADSFITLTCHYVAFSKNGLCLCSAVLGTRVMESTHTAQNLKDKIENIINEFDISGKMFACVHDNAANINLATKLSQEFLINVNCSAHTLQLSVNLGLKNSKIQKVIAASSRLVGHFKHSYKATNALKEKQLQLNLPQHKLVQSVVTRWNSVFDMFERLYEQRWAITSVLSDRNVTKLSEARTLECKDEDWILIEDMCKCLKPLKLATEAFSGENHVSISVTYPILLVLVNKHLASNDDDSNVIKNFKATVSKDIKIRFQNVFSNDNDQCNFLLIASFLDPRHKHLPFLDKDEKKTQIQNYLREEVEKLKVLNTSSASSSSTSISHVAVDESKLNKKKQTSSTYLLLGDDYFLQPSESSGAIDEVTYYLTLPPAQADADPFSWWASHKTEMPYLVRLAGNYLSIPSSSVASERMFSSSGRLLNKLRSSLSGTHVDQLLFLNKNKNC